MNAPDGRRPPPRTPEALVAMLCELLTDITADWDTEVEGEIGPQTRLVADLAFESIDVMHLVVAIEEALGRRGLPFMELLMKDGRYVDDVSVQQIAGFLATKT